MFRIFRKFREEILLGKTSRRFFSYAAGELVLVVLGILIALQINNWNEERIEQREIADYAHALIKDLERGLGMIEIIRKFDDSGKFFHHGRNRVIMLILSIYQMF